MTTFKPLLASPYDQALARFPLFVSPKLDGIRAIVMNGVVVSRSLKPIPNAHVQQLFGRPEYEGLDGELIVGSPTAPDCYNVTQSAVMSKAGEPDVSFHVFDDTINPEMPFRERLDGVRARVPHLDRAFQVSHSFMANHEAAMEMYAEYLDDGFEGIMLRSADAPYKFGRSTAKEGTLLKHKPLVDSDAEIVSVFEQMANGNEATVDALGNTKRSSHAENKTGKATLGGFTARDIHSGVEFNVGTFTGLKDADRKALWEQRETLPGKIFKYTSLAIGVKEKPRHPRFIGWRDAIDM